MHLGRTEKALSVSLILLGPPLLDPSTVFPRPLALFLFSFSLFRPFSLSLSLSLSEMRISEDGWTDGPSDGKRLALKKAHMRLWGPILLGLVGGLQKWSFSNFL